MVCGANLGDNLGKFACAFAAFEPVLGVCEQCAVLFGDFSNDVNLGLGVGVDNYSGTRWVLCRFF